MNVKTGTICTGGFTMDYFRFGHGDKPLVILPGLSVQSILPLAGAVAQEYAVMWDAFTAFVPERRREPPAGYTVGNMARDAVAAMEALGLRDICLFGASQGGMIALDVAAGRPDLVQKAAVASTALCMTPESTAVIRRWIREAEHGDGEGLYLAFGQAVYPPAVFEAYKPALQAAGQSVTQQELRRFIRLARAAEGYDCRARIGAIRCPLFAAGSVDDGVFGPGAVRGIIEAFAARPGFSYHVYEGFGHAAYDTAPDFRDRLYAFFTGN